MSWHDNYVHGLRILAGEHGNGELWLDLDHILEWIKEDGGFQFRLVPVWLKFTEVSDLRIALNYAASTAAIGPFSIAHIERASEERQHYVATLWKITINWPEGEIQFEATGYEQVRSGAEVLSHGQALTRAERGGA
jgi:hypothetical protein